MIKKLSFVYWLSILCFSVSLHAQKINTDLFKAMKARSIGPAAMSGRITAIDAVVANPDIIYAGAASGGVWKSENGGTTWTSIFDQNPMINIGAIAVQQSNPSVIWVGTGEGNPRNSLNLGAGIYKSLDGGKTWKLMGLEKTIVIHRIIIDPTNPNTVYVGATGNPFADHQERGVFKTTDGGKTWEKILYTNARSGVGDMIMDPTNPNKLFVGMWEHRRTPYNFKSGGEGSGFYMTLDGGKNWTKLNNQVNGIPKGELGRIGVAIARSEPNRVYALIESSQNALYRSDDGGVKWEKINDSDPETIKGNRPFYFWDLAVDPKNENRVYGVFQMISLSEDGGKTFKVIVPYSGVHPDHHAFWIHPEDPSLIIDGNDGGVAISRDRGRKWTYAEAIPIGQFYHIAVDNDLPYNIYGGLQDNGSWVGPSYTWQNGGIYSWQWQTVLGGDGFDVIPDPNNNRYGYAMWQGGNLMRYDKQTGNHSYIRPTADLNTRLRFNWNAAFALDPVDKKTIFYGSQFLHKSTDQGISWQTISPDLTTDNKEQQKASDQSGGLTIDITSAENHNTILCIAPSPVQQGVIWVGTDDGNVQLSRDGGKTWENKTPRITGLPKEAWIPQIRASSFSAGEAFVVANNYRQGDMSAYVFRTKDYGQTWTRIVDDSKVVGYALSVQQDVVEPNLIFVGTEQGLWFSVDDAATFSQWKQGIPSVSTMDLALQEREADLVLGTFGRSIFVLDNIRPLRKIAATKGKVLEQKLATFEQNDAYLASYRDADGASFMADANFVGENRNAGARLVYWYNKKQEPKKEANTVIKEEPKKKKDKEKDKDKSKEESKDKPKPAVSPEVKKDTVFVRIYNAENKLIRSIYHQPDTLGMQVMYWDLCEKGIRMPDSPKPKKNAPDSRGNSVFAGKYKIVFSLADVKDSTFVTVKNDPRVNIASNAQDAQKTFIERTQKSVSRLTEVTDRLNEMDEIAKQVQNRIKDLEGKEFAELNKATKAILDSIKTKKELITGKRLEKQGYGRPYQVTPIGKMREVFSYMDEKIAPTPSHTKLLEDFETLTNQVIEKVNKFVADDWAQYRKKVETTNIPLFKDYKPIER